MNVACDYAAPVQILNMEQNKTKQEQGGIIWIWILICDTCVWFYINVLNSFFQNSKA